MWQQKGQGNAKAEKMEPIHVGILMPQSKAKRRASPNYFI